MDLPRPAPSSSNPTEIRHGRLLAMQAVCSWKHTSVGSSISILSRAELVHKFKDMINVRLMGASPMDKFR
ncbi:Os06g0653300 [Oryza sativa Japonica Group]|uniref:Os06g0653300 protein n=1 Tax=Oryza sativa subsp. japonica TaxID=39947 RepID=Q0DAG9_ORYSJ|nr:Os06g0653300 [Oryza sativa Japonica Group]|eukprot:NP_001058240.1 Os06g0653300 [Oryza sativa Japonica Group]